MGVALPDSLSLRGTVVRRIGPGAFGVEPLHQHPPKMPLLSSTSAANAAHVDESRAFTVHVGSAIEPSPTRAPTSLFVPN